MCSSVRCHSCRDSKRLHLHVVPLLVRDQDYAGDSSHFAMVQQCFLRLHTQHEKKKIKNKKLNYPHKDGNDSLNTLIIHWSRTAKFPKVSWFDLWDLSAAKQSSLMSDVTTVQATGFYKSQASELWTSGYDSSKKLGRKLDWNNVKMKLISLLFLIYSGML